LNYHPVLREFLRGGDAESYEGVAVEWRAGELPILTVYREEDGGDDDASAEIFNLWSYETKEELHELMRRWFRLKDAAGRREARVTALQRLKADEEAALRRKEYYRLRKEHVDAFQRDVISPITGTHSGTFSSTLPPNTASCPVSPTNSSSPAGVEPHDSATTAWLAENYDIMQKARSGDADVQELFVTTNHRQGDKEFVSRNEALLRMYKEEADHMYDETLLIPRVHKASVTVKTRRRSENLISDESAHDEL